MAIRNILTEEDPTLKKTSRTVEKFDQRLWTLLDDMQETMNDADGAGLAAPQVGVLRRAFVVADEEGGILEFVNPEILEEEGEQVTIEGCLSIPNYFAYTQRPMKVKMQAVDRFGKLFTVEAEGHMAKALSHEYDHLNGKLFRSHVVREDDDTEE